jgi:iron complex outermembrane recepter protein
MNGIKPLSRCLALAFGGSLVIASTGVYAQDATKPEAAKQERIEVTGSNIKQIEAATSAPVQVITREQIEKTGATSVEQLLRSVTVATSSGGTVTSNASGATTGGISSVSLRGLGSTRTLILVNGKRIAPYGSPSDSASIDVDNIPLALIERVEVLKDGASAIYGSDAIAGVVNFILRKDYQGAEVAGSYGAAYDGKAKAGKISVIGGWGDLGKDRFNFTLSAGYQKEDPLYGRDREFSKSGINVHEQNFSFSSNTFPGNIRFLPGTRNSSGVLLNRAYNPSVPNCSPSVFAAEFSTTQCLFDFAPFVALTPEIERKNVSATGHFLISEAAELYGEASYARKDVRTIIQPVPISGIRLASTTAFYPTLFVQSLTGGATPTIIVGYRNFIGGNRDITDTGDASRFNFGSKGTIAGWDYDAGVLYSTGQVTEKLNGGYPRLATDATGPGLRTLLSTGVVDLFGNGTPDSVKATALATNFNEVAFKSNTTLKNLYGRVSSELGNIGGGAVGFATGFDIRQDGFKLNPNDVLSQGNISGYGGNFLPIDINRNARAAFIEFNAPITKAINLDGALRYDTYGGVTNPNSYDRTFAALTDPNSFSDPSGNPMTNAEAAAISQASIANAASISKVTGKFGIRWQPIKEVLIRATAGTGFRVPSITEQFGPIQQGLTGSINDTLRCNNERSANADPNLTGPNCANQFTTYSGGNANLKPEESRNATFGIIVEPNKDLSFDAAYFFTRVTNFIGVNDAQSLVNSPVSATSVIRGPVDVAGLPGPIIAIDQTLVNTPKVFVSGFDLGAKFRLPATNYGKITLGWSGTYIQRWDSQNVDGSYSTSLDVASSSFSGIVPRLKQVYSLNWDMGPWNAVVTYNWQGGYKDICGNSDSTCVTNFDPTDPANNGLTATPQRKVGSYETWDIQGTYAGVKDLKLTLGVRNLFNRKPPYSNIGGNAVFQAGYDPSYTDPKGRFLYLNASYKIW